MPRKPGISFKYENILLVSKKIVSTEALDVGGNRYVVSPEKLQTVLELGRTAIDDQIEMIYNRMRSHNPTVVRPSIYAVQLTNPDQSHWDVFVEGETGNLSGGVVNDPAPLKPDFIPYWQAVESSGFFPEVGRGFTGTDLWLMLRKDRYKRSEKI